MTRPSALDLALGNRAGVAFTSGLTLVAIVLWATQEQRHESIPWIAPALALLLARAAVGARRRVVAYTRWRASWDDMSGAAPATHAPRGVPAERRREVNRRAATLLVWGGSLWWLAVTPHVRRSDAFSVVATLFALTSAWGASGILLRLGRRLRSTGTAAGGRAGAWVVTCCLGAPRGAPNPSAIRAALPDYCQRLLSRHPRACGRESFQRDERNDRTATRQP